MESTAAVLAWIYDIRPMYAVMFMGLGWLVWLVQAPLKMAEVHRQRAIQAAFLQRHVSIDLPGRILLQSELMADRPLIVLALVRRTVLLAVGVLLLVTTIGLTDPDGPRYVDRSTRLGRDLTATGGSMPLDDLDFGWSLLDAIRNGGVGAVALHLFVPLLFLLVCWTSTRARFPGMRRRPIGIAVVLATAVLVPSGVLLYVWFIMILNNTLIRFGTTPAIHGRR